VDELDVRFSEDAQAELLQVFQEDLTVSGAEAEKEEDKADEALDIVKDEDEEAHKMEDEAEQKEEQLTDEVYADEDEDYDEAEIMPDEENDLSESALEMMSDRATQTDESLTLHHSCSRRRTRRRR
jgi:hypothetical protein